MCGCGCAFCSFFYRKKKKKRVARDLSYERASHSGLESKECVEEMYRKMTMKPRYFVDFCISKSPGVQLLLVFTDHCKLALSPRIRLSPRERNIIGQSVIRPPFAAIQPLTFYGIEGGPKQRTGSMKSLHRETTVERRPRLGTACLSDRGF